MAIKNFISLVTPFNANEQSNASTTTQTASGLSREYRELSNFQRAVFFLDVSAASGTTPSLVVALQMQDPVSTKWQNTTVLFPAQTAATGATPLAPMTLDLYALNYRLAWTITGTTPSFTFSCCCVAGVEEPVI